MNDSDGVLVVFTAKTVEQVLKHGGTRSWVLNPKSMASVAYVVCTRNSDRQHDAECGIRPEAHNSAFIVGRVAGLEKVDHRHDRDRYLVKFSEYALVDVPNFRHGLTRNPVTYSNVAQCRLNGIDLSGLVFQPMPSDGKSPDSAHPGMSMVEAKLELAAYYGVQPEAIQITIVG